MEGHRGKYILKLLFFITTLTPRKNSIDVLPENVKISDFSSILYNKPLRNFEEPKFKVGGRFGISRYDLNFKKGYEPQLRRKVFEIVASFSRMPPTYTAKTEQDAIICGKFY